MLNAFRHHRFPRPACGGFLCWKRVVLNAFRHHRFPRFLFMCSPDSVNCAQRLSASQISTHSVCEIGHAEHIGAQRLSASQISTQIFQGKKEPCNPVLNAFRHHRFPRNTRKAKAIQLPCAQRLSASQISTLKSTTAGSGSPFSAQRLSASQISTRHGISNHPVSWPCSTPFGITDFHACPYADSGRRNIHVLNAFRHHRFPRSPRCPCHPGRRCAQRLSASQISTRRYTRTASNDEGVLNAFRHHRFPRSIRVTVCF